ncbi:hypothetical protein BJX99DRAFT_269624 [Aspergillus californicus]
MLKPRLSKTSSQYGQNLSTPSRSRSPSRVKPDGAVIVLASYKAYESTPLAKSSTSAHRSIPSGTVTSSHSVGSSSGRNGLRNGTNPLPPSVTASVRAKSSEVISPTSIDIKDRNTSARAMTTPTVSPVFPSSGTSPANSTSFTGAGTPNIGMSAMIGGVILLTFLWFLWQWGSGGSW